MKFRKKPVVIDAIQFQGTPASANEVFDLFTIPKASLNPGESLEVGTMLIPTLEGMMFAGKGDWIIRGVSGEFYPCKDPIFRATYDAV